MNAPFCWAWITVAIVPPPTVTSFNSEEPRWVKATLRPSGDQIAPLSSSESNVTRFNTGRLAS